MKHIICAVHDRQLNCFMRPFTAQSTGQAIRSFRDETNNKGTDLNKHPEDYTLHTIGEFDEQTGELVHQAGGPIQIAIASNLLEKT